MTQRQTGGMSVLVICDPGLPSRRIASIQEHFEASLQEAFAPPVQLHTRTEVIRLRPDNVLDVGAAARISKEYDRVDLVLMLTEIPRHHDGKPLVAEIFADQNVAVVSCPTLGAWTTKRRIRTVLLDCVLRMAPDSTERASGGRPLRWSRWETEDPEHQTLYANTVTGSPRTVLGMAIANDPWRTSIRLSSALAAASATGAFGIFYNSIWQMAEYLSTTRLLSIGVLAVTSMVAWLILSNRLWDKPVSERLGRVVMLYNFSTVLTLLACVLLLYAVLVGLILFGGLIVIDPEFMTQIIGTDATFLNYLDVAWLSAAMGVVAGGLGSSFDSETDLRRLTHGQRERQRRYTLEEDENPRGEEVDDAPPADSEPEPRTADVDSQASSAEDDARHR